MNLANGEAFRAARKVPFNPFQDEHGPSLEAAYFNWFLEPSSRDANTIVYEAFKEAERCRRRRNPDSRRLQQRSYDDAQKIIAAILSNLLDHFYEDCPWVIFPRSRHAFNSKDGTKPSWVSYKVVEWLDRLVQTGWVEERRSQAGPASFGKATTIAPGLRLDLAVKLYGLSKEHIQEGDDGALILMRDKRSHCGSKGKLIAPRQRPELLRVTKELETINHHLNQADLSWVGGQVPDLSNRNLRRTFMEASFEKGGRLGGGFWPNLSKDQRLSSIRIDGEEVVELDYSSMYPRLAYGMVGQEPPFGDPYDIPGLEECDRCGIKKVMNALF